MRSPPDAVSHGSTGKLSTDLGNRRAPFSELDGFRIEHNQPDSLYRGSKALSHTIVAQDKMGQRKVEHELELRRQLLHAFSGMHGATCFGAPEPRLLHRQPVLFKIRCGHVQQTRVAHTLPGRTFLFSRMNWSAILSKVPRQAPG